MLKEINDCEALLEDKFLVLKAERCKRNYVGSVRNIARDNLKTERDFLIKVYYKKAEQPAKVEQKLFTTMKKELED